MDDTIHTFAITKLNNHCVIRAAAIVRDRTWLGYWLRQSPLQHENDQTSSTYSALRTQHERNRTPAKRIEHHEQVNAHNRKGGVAVKGLAWNDRVNGLINADVEHGKGLSGSADDERPFAAKLLSSNHQTDSGDDDLDNTIDSCCE
jgi:hypothetical protein